MLILDLNFTKTVGTSEKISSDNESPSFSPNVTFLGDEICLTPLHNNPSTPNLSSPTDFSGIYAPKSPRNENNIENSDEGLPHTTLQNLRLKNVDKIILGHININSIRNKFHLLADMIRGRVDILLISETKLDSTFPSPQFFLQGYSEPHRLDRNAVGVGSYSTLEMIYPLGHYP